MTQNKVNIVFVGDSSVGKTSIIRRFETGSFDDSFQSTIGASAYAHKPITIKDQEVNVCLWDTAGQECFRGLTPQYYRKAQIIFIVFSLDNEDSWNNVSVWLSDIEENIDTSNIQIAIVGNKEDQQHVVNENEVSRFSESKNALYHRTSCKEGTGIDSLFMQEISRYLDKSNPSTESISQPNTNVKDECATHVSTPNEAKEVNIQKTDNEGGGCKC